MANLTITNQDFGSVILKEGQFRDDELTFTGADVYAAGTILARDTATGKYIAFVKGGSTNGNGIPKAVLTYSVTATGAGDITIRDMVSGSVRKARLIIDADGDATNVDFAVIDALRDFTLVTIDVTELNDLDNQ